MGQSVWLGNELNLKRIEFVQNICVHESWSTPIELLEVESSTSHLTNADEFCQNSQKIE